MNVKKFNNTAILALVVNVRRYKKLYVTTEGVMFRNEQDAENAVRTKNMIISDPADFVGYVEITEDTVTTEKVRGFAKDYASFEALFKDAKIPRQRKQEVPEKRKPEETEPFNASEVAELEAALGLADTAPAAPALAAPAPAEGAEVKNTGAVNTDKK